MFLDDEIVEIASKADWRETIYSVEGDIMLAVITKIGEKSKFLISNHGSNLDMIIELKRVKKSFELGINKLKKQNINIPLSWEEIIRVAFEGNEKLINITLELTK